MSSKLILLILSSSREPRGDEGFVLDLRVGGVRLWLDRSLEFNERVVSWVDPGWIRNWRWYKSKLKWPRDLTSLTRRGFHDTKQKNKKNDCTQLTWKLILNNSYCHWYMWWLTGYSIRDCGLWTSTRTNLIFFFFWTAFFIKKEPYNWVNPL